MRVSVYLRLFDEATRSAFGRERVLVERKGFVAYAPRFGSAGTGKV